MSDSDRLENSKVRWLKVALSNMLAIICLIWVVYHVHPETLWSGIKRLRWPLVIAAIAADQFSFVLQALRWKLLLQPVAPISFRDAIQAVYVGLFTNDVLPMRVGELVRAHMISQRYSSNFSEIVPSMMVERMFEGIWLSLGIGLTTIFLSMPRYLEKGAQIFGALIVLLIGGFLYFVFREEKALQAGKPRDHIGKIRTFVDEIAIGLRRIGITGIFCLALGVTLGLLAFQALAMWLVIHAYDLPLPPWEGFVVYLVLRVGIIIPSTPANIGTYQFFTSVGLQMFGIARSIATGFSFVSFFVLSGPMWLIGFFAMSRSGMTLFRLKREAFNFMEGKPPDS
jgi:glycosyltransferase 2 family protein